MGTDVHWYKNWISWAPCAWLWNLLMSRQKQPVCMWSADKCLLLLIYHGCLYNYTVTNGHFGAGAIRHLFCLLQGKKQFKKLLWTIPARSPLQFSEIALQFVTTIPKTFQCWKQPHAGALWMAITVWWVDPAGHQVPTKAALSLPLLSWTERGEKIGWKAHGLRSGQGKSVSFITNQIRVDNEKPSTVAPQLLKTSLHKPNAQLQYKGRTLCF